MHDLLKVVHIFDPCTSSPSNAQRLSDGSRTEQKSDLITSSHFLVHSARLATELGSASEGLHRPAISFCG